MATQTFMDSFLTINFALLPSVEASVGLGEVAVICEEGATPFGSEYGVATSTTEVAAYLAAGNINAAGAAQATALLSQTYKPQRVYFGTYTSLETPDEGLNNLIAADIDFGVAVIDSVVDADLHAVGDWLNTSDRGLKYLIFAESRLATLLTSGKPTDIDGAELDAFRLVYGASSVGLAGALAGTLAGKGLAGGPAAAQVRVTGIDLPGVTAAEAALAVANDVGVLMPADVGASASERYLRGTTTYSGQSFTAIATMQYTVRKIREGLTALVAAKAILAEPLLANSKGVGEVEAAINKKLAPLAAVGHYSPGTSNVNGSDVTLADGYRVTATKSGSAITATVLVRLNQEVFTITVNGIGEVI